MIQCTLYDRMTYPSYPSCCWPPLPTLVHSTLLLLASSTPPSEHPYGTVSTHTPHTPHTRTTSRRTVAHLRDPCPIGVHGLYALDAEGDGEGSLVDASLEHAPRYVQALRPVDDRSRAGADDLQRVEEGRTTTTILAVSVGDGVSVYTGGENAARGCGRRALRTPRQRSRRDGDGGERRRGRCMSGGGGGKEHE